MKHAYLIMCHSNFEQLLKLLTALDNVNNDIYIHVDAKVKYYPKTQIKSLVKEAGLIFVKRTKVNWAGYSQIKAELNLLEEATKTMHEYYHLLSGVDLPLKSQREIYDFFRLNQGKEYIGIDTTVTNDSFDHDRVRYYYIFQDYIGRKTGKLVNLLRRIERISIETQKRFDLDRTRKNLMPYGKGAQWFSITHQMAKYVVNRKKQISRLFKHTLGPDEFFLQTIALESPYCNQIVRSSLRCIDWKRGSPYIFTLEDAKMLEESEALFARKFDSNVDIEIIDAVLKRCLPESCS